MRHLIVAPVVGLLVSGCAFFASTAPVPTDPGMHANLVEPGVTLDPAAARELLNRYRRASGLPAVALDARLMRMAEEQARAMAAADEMNHTLAGAGSFTARLRRSDYDAGRAAENLGMGYKSIAHVFAGWRKSSSHNANMLLADAKHMGIAAVQAPGGRGRIYWALVLAQPAEEPPRRAGAW